MKLENASIHAWIEKYKIKTENGVPFDYKDHFFWFDVLSDWNPKQVWLKAAQMGGSLVANMKAIWAVKNHEINAAYTLPTAHDVKDFVGGKTNPFINNNPILAEWVHDKDTVEQKRIGNNMIYFRGTMTERAALSFTSDLNIHDESSRSDRRIIGQYASRQQHSPYQWEWFFSNPAGPNDDLATHWEDSDKKEWFVSCPSCSKTEPLVWPDSISEAGFICCHCKKVLPDNARRKGKWFATNKEGNPKWSGYHFSLLMAPWVTHEKIIEYSQTKSIEYFTNFVLGLPFVGRGSSLIENEFFSNLTSEMNPQDDPIVIGCDTGLPNWFVVGNKRGIFYWGKCDGYDEIRRLMRRFKKAIMVIDQGGDLIGSRELQEEFSGRVFLCYYQRDRKTMQLIRWGQNEELGRVTADRNRCIQMLIDELRDKRIPIQGSKTDWWETWVHFSNIYRVVEEDKLGQEQFVWERKGPDHLVHAMNYWRIGMDKFGMEPDWVGPSAAYSFAKEEPSFEITPDFKAPARIVPPEEPYDWRKV